MIDIRREAYLICDRCSEVYKESAYETEMFPDVIKEVRKMAKQAGWTRPRVEDTGNTEEMRAWYFIDLCPNCKEIVR